MITLKQIEITENKASANYYPDDSSKPGYIVVDLASEEIEQLQLAEDYESSTAPAHALSTLVAMAKDGDKRKERIVMWY